MWTPMHTVLVLPDDSSEQEAVCAMIVGGVVVAPQLRPGEREVPELIDETVHSLLLSRKPLVIAVPCLHNTQHKKITQLESCNQPYRFQYYVLTTKSFGL